MKYQVTIETENKEEALHAILANDAFDAFEEIRQRIFRPARKHGYAQRKMSEFIEKLTDKEVELVSEFVGLLEDEFTEIIGELRCD
jgi:hypothetical protein